MFSSILVGFVATYAAMALASVIVLRSDGHSSVFPASPIEPPARSCDPQQTPFVSVVVAARDEEAHLPGCLRALKRQSLPRDRYEIIVSDDHSSDGTCAVAAEFGVRCVSVADGVEGKAAAVHAGVESARGSLIVVTDADCRPPHSWLAAMAETFRDGELGMVCGVTAVAGRTLLARIQAADWTLLLTMAAGFSSLGLPLTAMGNNMAFRRKAYDELGGYPELDSSVTEDYVLFREMYRRTSWRVRLLIERPLRNVTLPLPTLAKVIRQRRRWARGGLRADVWVYLFYALVYATHAAVVVALVIAPPWGVAALLTKIAADALVVHVGGRRIGQRHLRAAFLAFELYLFLYVLALPVLLLLAPRIRWRGRRW